MKHGLNCDFNCRLKPLWRKLVFASFRHFKHCYVDLLCKTIQCFCLCINLRTVVLQQNYSVINGHLHLKYYNSVQVSNADLLILQKSVQSQGNEHFRFKPSFFPVLFSRVPKKLFFFCWKTPTLSQRFFISPLLLRQYCFCRLSMCIRSFVHLFVMLCYRNLSCYSLYFSSCRCSRNYLQNHFHSRCRHSKEWI